MPLDNQQIEREDRELAAASVQIATEQTRNGLGGLVGGLDHLIINTEPDRLTSAVSQLLETTGLESREAFEDDSAITHVLKTVDSADFLITSRKSTTNPFRPFNINPKSQHLPNTRMETLVFKTFDLEKYFAVQKTRGVEFMTRDIIRHGNRLFIQTRPSSSSGISFGFVQWLGSRGNYQTEASTVINDLPLKPEWDHLSRIGYLDHAALRIKASDRTRAITEFMKLTGYRFDFAIYVRNLNSITSVTRLSPTDFALVFTSGIPGEGTTNDPGPTEQFVRNYGIRLHHMAFKTDDIDRVFGRLKESGQKFLLDLVGSEQEGLKQTFTEASPDTLVVTEYIHRFGDFDGFFTRSNVEQLTRATERQ
ncbi:MAG: hypothetical protein ACRKGH_00335 [Dehalogenimonas sp.]